MADRHNPKLRFGITLREAEDTSFEPSLANAPPLPAVNYGLVGKQAPSLLSTQSGQLPKASAVVMTWASAEWAALEQVFCGGGSAMPYSERSRGTWAGWEKYSANLPSDRPSGWSYWGYYRTVEIHGKVVLLFKSNTHLDWPGATFLTALVKLIIAEAKPGLILSIGTAGGTKPQDHIGTVRAVSAGTLFETGKPAPSWPEYKNGWTANGATLGNAKFDQLLFPVPTKAGDLQALCSQFNQRYHTDYTLAQLNPNGLKSRRPCAANRQSDRRRSFALDSVDVRGRNDSRNLPELCGDRDGRRGRRRSLRGQRHGVRVRAQSVRPGAERGAAGKGPGELGRRGLRRVRLLHEL